MTKTQEPALQEPTAAMRGAGALSIILGAAVLVAAILVTDEMIGRPSALIDRWFFSVASVALMTFGICLRRGATVFGILAFVLIAGGAAQLYITEPLWFPVVHLNPKNWKEWATWGVLAVEALTALVVLGRTGFGLVLAETQRRLGLGRIAGFVLMTGILSVPLLVYVSRGAPGPYVAHVIVEIGLTVVHLLVLAAMTQVRSPISGLYRLSPLVPATVTLVVSLLLSWYAFERIPHVEDEVAYLFQARTFAGGALTVPLPPPAALPGLDYYLLETAFGRWYSATAPGWPAVLSLGVLVGAPWIVNPILAALSVLLAHAITRRLADRDLADLVAMMMGASPWLLAMAASYMTHTLTLFLALLAWWLILGARTSTHRRRMQLFAAGLCMGWIFATRPLDGVVVGGLTGLWLLLGPWRAPVRAAIYAAGCIVTGSVALVYNMVITGNPFSQPLNIYIDRTWGPGANAYGFGDKMGPPGGWVWLDLWPGHSFTEAVINTLTLLSSLELDMMGWSIGSLALVFAFFLWQKPDRTDRAMMLTVFTVIAAMFFYWFADSYYIGPRYWFLAAFPLFYLSARGFVALRDRFRDKGELSGVRLDALLWYCCIFGFCVFLPWRAVTKYYEYGNFHPTVAEDAADGRFDGAVVLVAKNGEIGSTVMLNDPWLRGTIYLYDTGSNLDEAAISAAFPGRPVIRYRAEWTGH